MTDEVYSPELKIGQVQWACSDDECSGPDVGLLLRLSESDFIWCGEITREEGQEAGVPDTGWHIVLHRGRQRTVIASVRDRYDGQDFVTAIETAIREAKS